MSYTSCHWENDSYRKSGKTYFLSDRGCSQKIGCNTNGCNNQLDSLFEIPVITTKSTVVPVTYTRITGNQTESTQKESGTKPPVVKIEAASSFSKVLLPSALIISICNIIVFVFY